MKNAVKMVLTLLCMVAVLGYTVYNYTMGKTDLTMLMVSVVILGIPFINIIHLLIQELKNK